MENDYKSQLSDQVRDYKHSKNKLKSRYVTAKNERKYSVNDYYKRKHKNKNYKRNHFESPSIKKKANRAAFELQMNDIVIYKHRHSPIKSDILHADIVNTDFTFHHKLKDLLSLRLDQYYNQRIFIKYFGNINAQFQGRLTTIGQSGYFRIENIIYRGDTHYKKHSFGNNLGYYYWFHLNATRRIYIDNCHCRKNFCYCHDGLNNSDQDLTNILTDIMKFKMVNYFLFICSYKQQQIENSPLKEITKHYIEYEIGGCHIDEYIERLKDINLSTLQQCSICDSLFGAFAYGKSQNDFDHVLTKRDWKKSPTYLQSNDILRLINNYKDILIEYLEQESSYSLLIDSLPAKSFTVTDDSEQKTNFTYLDWDNKDIRKTQRIQMAQNRTV